MLSLKRRANHPQISDRGGCSCSLPLFTPNSSHSASDGSQGNGDSDLATISADARFIAFNSHATNLLPADTNGWLDVFLHDTCVAAPLGYTPQTTCVSVGSDGSQSVGGASYSASIGANGRYISFRTAATNLVSNNSGVVLRDTCVGAPPGCAPANRSLFVGYAGDLVRGAVDNLWVLGASGRYSGFGASATNLVPGNTEQVVGAFVYDACIGAGPGCIARTNQVSLETAAPLPLLGCPPLKLSDDENYVVFISIADNLLPYAYRASAVYVRMAFSAECSSASSLAPSFRSSGAAKSSISDRPCRAEAWATTLRAEIAVLAGQLQRRGAGDAGGLQDHSRQVQSAR